MPSNRASVWLYVMRSAKNLSQRKLASKVGVTNTAVSNAEGRGYASAETWAKLAVFFKTSTDAVLWLAGVIQLAAPPKEEVVEKIKSNINEMEPDAREKAIQLIRWVTDDP